MDEFILIQTFSGDEKISEREVPPNDYYDRECSEIDDRDYIVLSGITKTAVTNYRIGEQVCIFYSGDGSVIKLVSIIDDVLCRAEFSHKDDIFQDLNIVFEADGNSANVKLAYRINGLAKNISVKCGLTRGEDVNMLFEADLEKSSDSVKFQNISVGDLKNQRIFAEIFRDGKSVLKLQ